MLHETAFPFPVEKTRRASSASAELRPSQCVFVWRTVAIASASSVRAHVQLIFCANNITKYFGFFNNKCKHKQGCYQLRSLLSETSVLMCHLWACVRCFLWLFFSEQSVRERESFLYLYTVNQVHTYTAVVVWSCECWYSFFAVFFFFLSGKRIYC